MVVEMDGGPLVQSDDEKNMDVEMDGAEKIIVEADVFKKDDVKFDGDEFSDVGTDGGISSSTTQFFFTSESAATPCPRRTNGNTVSNASLGVGGVLAYHNICLTPPMRPLCPIRRAS